MEMELMACSCGALEPPGAFQRHAELCGEGDHEYQCPECEKQGNEGDFDLTEGYWDGDCYQEY